MVDILSGYKSFGSFYSKYINLNYKFMDNVKVDQSIKAVIGIFHGFLEMETHKSIGNEILKLASEKSISKLVIDTSNLNVIRQETQKWIEADWFPRAAEQGVKFMAFVIPQDILGKMSTQRVNQRSGGIEIQHVSSMEEAKSWIKSK